MSRDDSDLTEEQERTLFNVGETLLHIQTLEFALSRCMTCVFPPEAEMGVDAIFTLNVQNQAKTLGQLLKALRDAVEIEPEFDSRMRDYLKKRNLFIHGLFLDERFDFNTEEGRERIEAFVDDIYDDVEYLRTVFTAVYAQWRKAIDGEEHGLETLNHADKTAWAQHMERHESTIIPQMRSKPGKTMGKGLAPE